MKDVVNYFYSDIIDDYLSTYLPEQIKVGQVNTTPNYPTDIPYADMSNNTPNAKAAALRAGLLQAVHRRARARPRQV